MLYLKLKYFLPLFFCILSNIHNIYSTRVQKSNHEINSKNYNNAIIKKISFSGGSFAAVKIKPMKKMKKPLSWLNKNKDKIKLFLTLTCVFFVTIEMLEDIISDIPYFKIFGGKVWVNHGVLLISLSHIISHYSELSSSFEDMEHVKFQIKVQKYIHNLTEKLFSSEIAAANAYDQAALLKFGKSAPLNFNENLFKNKYSSRYWISGNSIPFYFCIT